MNEWLASLWTSYSRLAPRISAIPALFADQGESIVNDHVAFRTFDLAPINIQALQPWLESLGYVESGRYEFETKKLFARSYSHPEGPRVFLSELRTDLLSDWARGLIENLVRDISPVADPSVFYAGTLWGEVAYSDYQRMLSESEYGAWVMTMGLVPNHFTVSINALSDRLGLKEVLTLVEDAGFRLNLSGGRIKGTPATFLEQGSTLADRIEVDFVDGRYEVPSCYYEFASRYAQADGRIFDGFVVGSADKIFESTSR